MRASILKEREDGLGFFYGHVHTPDGTRRVDVRHEPVGTPATAWAAYVDGGEIGRYASKDNAEAAAIAWIKEHREEGP